jgi:hypothetical protein
LNSTLGYTAILHNSDVASLIISRPLPFDANADPATAAANFSGNRPGSGAFLGDTESAQSVFAVGLAFSLVAKQITSAASLSTTLTIIGNETGGSATISVTNNRVQLVSTS